jgi:hypothetical protein
MKNEAVIRVLSIFLAGVGVAIVWLLLSVPWAAYVELGAIYPLLHRLTESNGAWMIHVGNTLFALTTAVAFSFLTVLVFGNIRWLMLGVFLVGYAVGQLLSGLWSNTPLSFLVGYLPLWLFVLFFALASSLLSSRMPGIWPNNSLKSDAAEPHTLG